MTIYAQVDKNSVYGTWVKCKATYKDGTELSDDNMLKHTYMKYTITPPDEISVSLAYEEQGRSNFFELENNNMTIKTPEGGWMNTFQIAKQKDTLTVLQPGINGIEDPSSLKFYFVPETVYQNSLPLKPDDIQSVVLGDTIYKASPKVYANFRGASFQSFIYSHVAGDNNMTGNSGYLAASFVVSKTGVATDLKILEGIDDKFDKRFIKAFNQANTKWRPALLNGKFVSVQMMVWLRYSTSAVAIPSYFLAKKADDAYNDKHYDVAIYFYDKALETDSLDKESLYKRGMCKMLLSNISGACEDWKKAKALGSNSTVDALLKKYCK